MPTYKKGHACKGANHSWHVTKSRKTKICTKCGSVRPGPSGKLAPSKARGHSKRARKMRRRLAA